MHSKLRSKRSSIHRKSTVARTTARKTSQARKKKSTVKKSSGRHLVSCAKKTANFWCMGCKDFSLCKIERYDKSQRGGLMAKGHCPRCSSKVSVCVKQKH